MTSVSITACGMTSAIGMTAASACAAARATLSNFTETKFISSGGTWIFGAQVPLSPPTRGLERLSAMMKGPLEECFASVPDIDPAAIPVILCVAEKTRPGRIHGLEQHLLPMALKPFGIDPNPSSSVLPYGRAAGIVALRDARALIATGAPAVIVAGVDSLLVAQTLRTYESHGRLLTEEESNGFPAGEAGAAVVVMPGGSGGLSLMGLGFGTEAATIYSEEPHKANGMVEAFKGALSEAEIDFHLVDYRIADVTGESFYFREAALAMTRVLKKRKVQMDIWHPTSEFGYVGAASFPIMLGLSLTAGQKRYAPGPIVLAHTSDDEGRRGAAVLRMEG